MVKIIDEFKLINENEVTKRSYNLLALCHPVILTAISTANKQGLVLIRASLQVGCTLQHHL